MTRRASFPIKSFKAIDRKAGTFEALVAVFGNVDLVGDRILPGAFEKSLEIWRSSGDPIPILWSHQWDDPFAHIGFADPKDVVETPDGLMVQKGVLDMEKPFAAQVFDLMASRRVREFSFAYDVIEETKSKEVAGANDLITLDLFEAGPTLKGANPETQLIGTKAFRDELNRQIADLEAAVDSKDDATAPVKDAPKTKARVELAGSIEASLQPVARAVSAWAFDTWGYDLFFSYVEATFDDRAIVYVETWDDDWDAGSYWEVPYTRADDGTITLGDPVGVEIEAQIVPKKSLRRHGRKDRKAGARNSSKDAEWIQSIHDASAELGGACAEAVEPEASDEGAGGADPKTAPKAEDIRLIADADLELMAALDDA